MIHAYNIFRFLQYDTKRFFVAFLVLIIALIIDIGISNIADIVSKQVANILGVALFTTIAAVYIFSQYFIRGMIKAKNKESNFRRGHILKLEKFVTIIQSILAGIMIFVVLEIIFTSQYYINLLTISTTISYGLNVTLACMLAFQLFSWFRLNKNLAVLLFGLASAAIAVNSADIIIFFDDVLLGKPPFVSPRSEVIFQVGFNPNTPMSMVSLVQSNSLIAYFILTWAGSILLLRNYIQKIGKLKFWLLVPLPLVYFLSNYVTLYQTLNPSSPVTSAISSNLTLPVLLGTYSIVLSGVLFGIGFRSITRSIKQRSHVRDYMIIAAYGFILFYTAAGATVLQAGYPPFGLANVSVVGLGMFMIMIGLYYSALSIAQDTKLRQVIKQSTLKETRLLDSISTAQIQHEVEAKVITATKTNMAKIVEAKEVETSLTDEEVKNYIEQVLEEVARGKGSNA
jgi:hypothetical protein